MEDPKHPNTSTKEAQYDKDIYELRLYVVTNSKKSQLALDNLKEICYKYLKGKCHIEVIDLKKDPALAREDQIIAIPTLVRKNRPTKKIIGDLSDPNKVLDFLDLRISNLIIDSTNEKTSLKPSPEDELKASVIRNKRSKNNDLQPYINSDLRIGKPKAWANRYFFVFSPH